MSILIEASDVHFTHPDGGSQARPALDGVSLRIDEGELIALVGANGSGKTTLARHFNGLYIPSQGHVLVHGFDTRVPGNRHDVLSLVGMVFQRPEDQIVATIVEEDVAFGPENLRLPHAEVRKRVEESLKAVGMWEHRHRPPHLLSAGQMQRVAMAGTLAMRPRCIIFDETTAMLDPQGRRAVMERMHSLHQDGFTVIFITHFMNEAVQAGRVLVMQSGRLVADGSPRDIFARPELASEWGLELPPAALLAARLRRFFPALPENILSLDDLLEALPAAPAGIKEGAWSLPPAPVETERKPLIEMKGVWHTYGRGTPLEQHALRGVDFNLFENEAVGLLGPTGSGKSTLLQHLNGLLRPHVGSVRVGEHDLSDPKVTVGTLYRTVGLVFQDPDMQIFEQYVGDEIAFGPRHYLDKPALREQVRWAMQQVGLDFERDKDRLTSALSGGERRKVALASALAVRPEVLALDEPTAGLDPASRAALLERLVALKREGVELVVSSHNMDDVAALADRLTVLRGGESVLSGPAAVLFSQSGVLRSFRLDAPLPALIAERLRDNGWPLPDGIVTPAALESALESLTMGARHG